VAGKVAVPVQDYRSGTQKRAGQLGRFPPRCRADSTGISFSKTEVNIDVSSGQKEKPVKRAMLTTVLLMTFCIAVFGQHGTAPNGYYPPGYSMDTWTGEVVSTNDTTREITLTYTNGKKSETFTGVLKDNFQVKMKDGSMKELNRHRPESPNPSGIPKSARITVFYQAKTRKVDSNKVKYYEIFQINTVK